MINVRCSCGASFKTDDPKAITLWREWERKHTCIEQPGDIQAVTQATTSTETLPIGFAPLDLPGRKDPGLE